MTYIPNNDSIKIIATEKKEKKMRPLTPAEEGERAARKEHYVTNFGTAEGTRKEIKKIAKGCLPDIKIFCKLIENIATKKNPERFVDLKDVYGLTFDDWADKIRNDLALIWEYRNDLRKFERKGEK